MSDKLFSNAALRAAMATGIFVATLCAPSFASAETAVMTYKVAPGDTLDKIIQKFYPGTPLKTEVLRSAINEQNQGAFTKSDPKVLMAGVVINLPEQTAVANAALNPKGTVPSDKREFKGQNGLGGDSSNMHRNWVRFP